MKLPILLSIQLLAGGSLAAVLRQRQAPGTGTPPANGKTGKSKGTGKSPLAGFLGGIAGQPGNIGKLAGSLPQAKFAGQTALEPRIRKGAKRIVAKYGPYSMKGKGVSSPVVGPNVLIRRRRRSQRGRSRLIRTGKAS
jgi:hypothetical protein